MDKKCFYFVKKYNGKGKKWSKSIKNYIEWLVPIGFDFFIDANGK